MLVAQRRELVEKQRVSPHRDGIQLPSQQRPCRDRSRAALCSRPARSSAACRVFPLLRRLLGLARHHTHATSSVGPAHELAVLLPC
jgi:hypothetical protein